MNVDPVVTALNDDSMVVVMRRTVDADMVVAAFHDSFVKVMMPMMRRGRSP